MTIATILLIPSDGDPHGLLREGPCEARPPVMFVRECSRGHSGWISSLSSSACTACATAGFAPNSLAWAPATPRRALVLFFEGKPERMGLAAASWAMEGLDDWQPTFECDFYSPWTCDDLESVLYRAHVLVQALGGTLAYVDADGREVQP